MSFWVVSLIVLAAIAVGWVAKTRFAGREERAARRELRGLRKADSRGDKPVGGYAHGDSGVSGPGADFGGGGIG